ncbi:NosD domain-containing protein [Methanolobus sp. ZRKC2]|uniref:right-handed parallel beta-helix repeat-containing protein n=1 Tax=Methanolobus sp. ZRKC2 TaxID=3125783 RepID=UPI00325383D0
MISNKYSIVLVSLICILLACTGTVSAKEIIVGADLGNSTITAALANASNGDIITVTDGTYIENVDVMKQVVIRSQNGSANTTVQAQSSSDDVFHVYTSSVNISGFNIEGASDSYKAGIHLHSGTASSIVLNNTLSGNYYGIYVSSADDNILTNNNASNNSELGCYLYASTNNTLTGNTISSNKYNFKTDGGAVNHYLHNIGPSNEVDGKPIFYWTSVTSGQINSSSNAGAVYLVNCTGITVKDVEVSDYYGTMLVSTTNSTIENVTAANCFYGIYLFSSSDYNYLDNNNAYNDYWGICLRGSSNNTLTNNEANNATDSGIVVWYSSNYNNLTGNNAHDNSYGVYISGSSDNYLTGNNVNNNNHGIYLSYADNNNNLTGNNVSNNNYNGFFLSGSDHNYLVGNYINNSGTGFRLQSSQNNTLTNNYANDTTTALLLTSSPNNSIGDLILSSGFPKLSFVSGSSFSNIRYAATDANTFTGKTNVNGYVLISSTETSMNMDIFYDDAGLSSSDEAELSLFRWDSSNWTEVTNPFIDTSNDFVTANLTEYGTFGLFWSAASSVPTSTPYSGSDDGMSVYRKKQIMEQDETEETDETDTEGEVSNETISTGSAFADDIENTDNTGAYQTTASSSTTDTTVDSEGNSTTMAFSGIALIALLFFLLLWKRRRDEEEDNE